MKGLYISTNVDRVFGGKASSGGDSRVYQPLRAITPPGFCGKPPDTEFALDLSPVQEESGFFAGMGGGRSAASGREEGPQSTGA